MKVYKLLDKYVQRNDTEEVLKGSQGKTSEEQGVDSDFEDDDDIGLGLEGTAGEKPVEKVKYEVSQEVLDSIFGSEDDDEEEDDRDDDA